MPDAPTLPRVGAKAPAFRLPASNGETIALRDVAARGPVVLFFYPRADTPGCTTEACQFRDNSATFRDAGMTVLGVSPDTLAAVTRFARKLNLDYPLLADADHAVCERYGLWQEKSMYGRKYMGVVRTTFLIDRGGTILHVFEKVKPTGHGRQVLDWLNARPARRATIAPPKPPI